MWLKVYIFGIICALFYTNNFTKAANNFYFGTKIGPLSQLHHGVSGEVYAVDSRTLFLKNFNYDGEGPAAYFYVGNTRRPSNQGAFRLRDERGSTGVIKRYRNKDITLTLPEGKTLRDVKWFSVWCDEFSVNFGDVTIPKNLDFPRPHKINALNGVHGVASDNIVIVDAQTLLIPNFSYDGEAPDAKFWVGRGGKPTPQGIRIPDENGKETPLRRYDKKTIVLTLPGELTIFDIGHFGVWCEAFTVDFGHVRVPEAVNVPPSLKMLGISPQSKLNCEVLYDDLAFEVRWAVAGESIVVQLVSKLEPREYMSFGISPDMYHTEMIGADVAVAWIDRETGKGYAVDYHLDDKSQCSGNRGSCPDTRILANTNSIRLLNSAIVNGYSIITYQRPLKASDKYDLPIHINGSQAIAWAVGPLNQRSEVSYHSKYTKGDRYIDFGRQPLWNCPFADGERQQSSEEEPVMGPFSSSNFQGDNAYLPTTKKPPVRRIATPQPAAREGAWEIPPIQCFEPEDGVFYAQMGPTGGKHGYPAITGHVGWGISWYINGLLIPEINVVRGKTYTFVVEGGIDPEVPAKYHPFYITDDSVGGYEHKTDEEKAQVKIFAGVKRSRNGVIPTGVGRLCNWTPDPDGPSSDEYNSFGAYQRSLTLKCDDGEPGVITWTPDQKTPDTVYYQCFTHRYLGWRINVHDSCDDDAQASEIEETFVAPEEDDDSFAAEPSIRHESKLRPNENFALAHEKESSNIHFVNEPQKNTKPEIEQNESEISKLIADGIKAAEELEKSIAKEGIINTSTQTTSPLNRGEIEEILSKNSQLPEKEIHVPYDRPVLPTQSGLSVYLKPPQQKILNQNSQNLPQLPPIFRPVKLPLRRPISLERRPIHMARPQRPVIIPQPSMIVNHYKKPVSPFIRPFVKQKTVPIKSIASVLLLGEPTEIPSNQPAPPPPPPPSQPQPQSPVPNNNNNNNHFQKPLLQKPVFINTSTFKKKPEQPVLYPQKDKKPVPKPQYFDKPTIQHHQPPISYPPSKPVFEYKSDEVKPLKNTGFQPDSVIVEGGFRPIVRRGDDFEEDFEDETSANRRRDDNISEMDEAIEGDALFISSETQNKYFEPMFVPSPLDSVTSAKLKSNGAVTVSAIAPANHQKERLTGDLIDMEVEDGDDKMAVAAERQDIYYLPPDNRSKIPNKMYPEGTVVAYDGKAVLDTSLVNSGPSNVASNIYADVSRTETLIRNTPQFVPFRGEIPPLSPDFMPQQDTVQFSINRNGGPQSPVTEYFNPLSNTKNTNTNLLSAALPISTKLTLLKNTDGGGGSTAHYSRTKRAAKPHHTPEHHESPSSTTGSNDTSMTAKTMASHSVSHLYSHLLIMSCLLFTKMYTF